MFAIELVFLFDLYMKFGHNQKPDNSSRQKLPFSFVSLCFESDCFCDWHGRRPFKHDDHIFRPPEVCA